MNLKASEGRSVKEAGHKEDIMLLPCQICAHLSDMLTCSAQMELLCDYVVQVYRWLVQHLFIALLYVL